MDQHLLLCGYREPFYPRSFEHIHDRDHLSVCRALIRLQDNRRIRVLLHVTLHDRRRLRETHGIVVNRDMPLLIDRHDDRELRGCRRRLCLRQLNGECLLCDRLQTVHHEEDKEEEDDC